MKRRTLLTGMVTWPLATGAAHETDQDIVLVASARSPLSSIAPPDVRRLYLGIPIVQAGREVMPLINHSNTLVKELFLQKVLFMSAQIFERQMVSRVFRQGGAKIPEFSDLRTLAAALIADPMAVSFMMPSALRSLEGLKALNELWVHKA